MSARRTARLTTRTVVTVVGTALVLVVCMIGFRLAEPTRPYELRTARLDQWSRFQGGQVRVSGLQVAHQVREGDDVATTPGLFVAVVITAQAGRRDEVDVQDAQLRSGSRTYDPFTSTFDVTAPAGYETTKAVLFEVDAADLAALSLEYSDRGVIYRYYTTVRVPLGIDPQAADQVAAELTVPEPTSRVLP